MSAECGVGQAWDWLEKGQATLVDVRTVEARLASGMVPNSLSMYWSVLDEQLTELLKQNDKVLLLCDVGQESLSFCQSLDEALQGKVLSIAGGFDAWYLADLPTESCHVSVDMQRYDRQMRLSGVGAQGQEKLFQSHVLIVGVGGLGVAALQYLASAGVGEITLVDDDVVALSNLPRQVIYQTSQLGMPKVEAAKSWLINHNPEAKVHAINKRFSELNAHGFLRNVTLLLDCSDNLLTRKTINKNCMANKVPWVFAAINDFELQLSFFDASDIQAPCYCCLFPGVCSSDQEAVVERQCDEAGVLGVIPGVAGILQASEALKYLLGLPGVLKSRLLVDNLLTHHSKVIKYRANRQCSHHSTGNTDD